MGKKLFSMRSRICGSSTLESNWEKAFNLPESDYRFLHLGDGGIADNLGVVTAFRLLRQEMELERLGEVPGAPGERGRKYILLIIDAHGGITSPFQDGRSSPNPLWIGMQLFTNPLDGRRMRHEDPVAPAFPPPSSLVEENPGDPPPVPPTLRGETSDGIEVFFLSFDHLPARPPGMDEDCRPPNKVYREDVRAIKTRLRTKSGEQTLLFHAGRKVVKLQEEGLEEAFAP